ncbi:MAG: chromosomal replication initiator protein DnaA, partial [Bacteroidales bacterium]|nr:chromosomal replication initiator protein DnaA [Bacteroidales bacterium]
MGESNHIDVWKRCLQIIKSNVPDAVYQKWFLPVKPISLEGHLLTIEVPSD